GGLPAGLERLTDAHRPDPFDDGDHLRQVPEPIRSTFLGGRIEEVGRQAQRLLHTDDPARRATSASRRRPSPAARMDECGSESKEATSLAGTAPPMEPSRATTTFTSGFNVAISRMTSSICTPATIRSRSGHLTQPWSPRRSDLIFEGRSSRAP